MYRIAATRWQNRNPNTGWSLAKTIWKHRKKKWRWILLFRLLINTGYLSFGIGVGSPSLHVLIWEKMRIAKPGFNFVHSHLTGRYGMRSIKIDQSYFILSILSSIPSAPLFKSLSSTIYIIKPHYRAPTFAHDLRANLRNVAVPGTGLPLSFFCSIKLLGYVMIICINPILCFLGAINVAMKQVAKGSTDSFMFSLSTAYRQHLLFPDDWFSYWRLNCALASWYWLVTREKGYDLENKWTFLQK